MSRLEWAISGLLGLLIVIAVAVLVFGGLGPGASASAQTGGDLNAERDGVSHTARAAHELVAVTAHEWAADAQLLGANASWPAGTPLTPSAASWGFQFYSAAQQSTALFSVTGDNARLVRSSKTNIPLAPLSTDGWLLDSPHVLEILMANGGNEFVQEHGEVSLTMTLSLVNELEWQAKLIDINTNEVVSMTVNPTTGTIEAQILPAGEE